MNRRRLYPLLVAGLTASLLIAGMAWGGKLPRHNLTSDPVGANELGRGDRDGRAHVDLDLRGLKRKVCFQASWQDIRRPRAAHIHSGRRTQNGPVVVDLGAGVRRFQHRDGAGTAAGCATGVSRALIRAMRGGDHRFYVNIHNRRFPDGAVRDQLHMSQLREG